MKSLWNLLNVCSTISLEALHGALLNWLHYVQVDLDVDSQPVIQLRHSVRGADQLEPRGQINVRSMKTGSVTIQNLNIIDHDDLKVVP